MHFYRWPQCPIWPIDLPPAPIQCILRRVNGLLGTVNVVNQLGAMTGTLTIRYHRPTPLYREIRLEGRTTGTEGRKVFAAGSMWDGEVLLAEAEGIFISIDGDFRALMIERSASETDARR